MTDQHPITPSPELVGEWLCDDGYPWDPSEQVTITITTNRLRNIATQAARWGADMELEACCEYIAGPGKWFANPQFRLDELRDARRPKPPSLKDQALAQTDAILNDPSRVLLTEVRETLELNRRALEALDD